MKKLDFMNHMNTTRLTGLFKLKFNEIYPLSAKPPTIFGPNQYQWISDTFVQTWRLMNCCICRDLTTWRTIWETHESAVCSLQCLQTLEGTLLVEPKAEPI